jgi:hypothetical protein
MPQHHRIEFGLIGRLIFVVRRAASGFAIDQSQMDASFGRMDCVHGNVLNSLI